MSHTVKHKNLQKITISISSWWNSLWWKCRKLHSYSCTTHFNMSAHYFMVMRQQFKRSPVERPQTRTTKNQAVHPWILLTLRGQMVYRNYILYIMVWAWSPALFMPGLAPLRATSRLPPKGTYCWLGGRDSVFSSCRRCFSLRMDWTAFRKSFLVSGELQVGQK